MCIRDSKTLVREGKETREGLAELKGEVDDLKGGLLRVEGKLDRLVEIVGRPPEAIDPVEVIRRMQTTSVQGLTADQVVAREERVRAELEERAKGTGLYGLVATGAHIDQLTMEKLQEVAEKKAQAVVVEAKDEVASSNKSTLIKGGMATGFVTALVALIAALGGSEGIVSIIKAFGFGG